MSRPAIATEAPPAGVAKRLAELRALYVPERLDEAHARLAPPPDREPFALAVGRRLAELRALCDLTDHLHRRR